MSPKPELVSIELLAISKIRTDGETQCRVNVDRSAILEYAELMRSGTIFPPVRVWFDGQDYCLADGFQRLSAAREIGAVFIAAEVLCGSLEDARWDSYAANATHGVRRTKADIEAIVRRALEYPKSHLLSNVQIARHLHVPEATLRRWKKLISSSIDEDTVRLATRGGSLYPMRTANIGKNREPAVRPPSRSVLGEDLEGMRRSASPPAGRMINILGHWILGHSSATTTLSAIERLITELRSSRDSL